MLGRASTEGYICDCLLELMADKPLDTIRVTDLVRHAKISRTTFYRYFDSTYDVIQMVEDQFFKGLMKAQGGTFSPDLEVDDSFAVEAYITPGVDYLHENLGLVKLLNGRNGDPAFRMRLVNLLREAGRTTSGAGREMPSNRSEFLSEFVCGGALAGLDWLSYHQDDFTDEDMSQVLLYLWRHVLLMLEP